ncbi:MAG: methyltransferase [Phenylobacterium sp.]|uniref:methyltransferase n=1 Tax=Phenylobacterium sp. TaxID=1871053 RepID=UPI00273687FD|nr:methyltransferase [Phenylobacterium sp.]MDP3175045.1 methyltransferase [Phenylobacterium sp.]
MKPLAGVEAARLALLNWLADAGYRFTTPAPATHRRILLRRGRVDARDLVDIFGWNLPFDAAAFDPQMVRLMQDGEVLESLGGRSVSALRVASIGALLFLHSAFPLRGADSVFFGPDSYRFVDFIRVETPLSAGARIVDIGAGTGVGGIVCAGLNARPQLTLTDINPRALALARVNAAFAGVDAELSHSDGLPPGESAFDLVLANPPYLGGETGRTYSRGGGALGAELSVAWARAGLARLAAGGRMLLYTGAAITRDGDSLSPRLATACREVGCRLDYREIDPDVFPSTLLRRAYWGVERIAAVGAVMVKDA